MAGIQSLGTVDLHAPARTTSPSAHSQVTAFVAVNLVPMDEDRVLHDQTVLIEDGKIKSVGTAIPVPVAAVVVDGHGTGFLSPGLADMHSHSDTPEDLIVYREMVGYGLRSVSGYFSDKTHKYWAVTFVGYAINMLAVPALALAGNWPIAAGLMVAERTGRAIRRPAVESMLSHAGQSIGQGWDKVLRPSDASFFDTVFCQAQSGSDAARSRAGARSGARTDRGDDDQDQAVRSTHSATAPDGVP